MDNDDKFKIIIFALFVLAAIIGMICDTMVKVYKP